MGHKRSLPFTDPKIKFSFFALKIENYTLGFEHFFNVQFSIFKVAQSSQIRQHEQQPVYHLHV